MKKLMFALVAGVAATVATAASISQTGFESSEGFTAGLSPTNAASSKFIYVPSNTSEDGSTVKAYDGEVTAYSGARALSGESAQYLDLSTDGGTLYRTINSAESVGGNPQTVTSSLYIDTLVQFTVCDSAPEIDASAKLAIWLQASDDETTTNLMVKAKQWTIENEEGVLSGTSTAAVYKISGTYNAGTWYRLTVEDLGNVFTASGYGATGFKIRVGNAGTVGNPAYVTGDGVAFVTTGGADATSALTGFVGNVADFTSNGSVFMSLADSDNDITADSYTSTLAAVGFSGTGLVDDILFTTDNPYYTAPTSLDFTLTLGENISSVTYSIDGAAGVTVTETTNIGAVNTGSEISLTITPASSTWRTYTPSVAAGENVTVAGTTVTLNTITQADPNQLTAGATVSAVDSSAAVEDAGVAAAFTALGITNEGITDNITTAARYRAFLTWAENNGYDVARINGYDAAYTRFDAGLPIEMWVYVTTNSSAVAEYTASVVGEAGSERNQELETIYYTKYSVDAGTSLTLSDFTFASAGENMANLLDGDSANWTYDGSAFSGLDSVTVNAASNGVVLATTVTAASAKVGIATVAVSTYVPVYYTAVTLNKNSTSLVTNETEELEVVLTPRSAADDSVTWTTSDASVATVADGVVTAVGAGTATITVTATHDPTVTASCTVTVTAPVYYTAISLNKATTSLVTNETETLTATLTPAEAADDSVTWTSSDDTVATVAGGVVTAVGAGTATITVTATHNPAVTASCTVTVTAPEPTPATPTITPAAGGETEPYTGDDAAAQATAAATAVNAVLAGDNLAAKEAAVPAPSSVTTTEAKNAYYAKIQAVATVDNTVKIDFSAAGEAEAQTSADTAATAVAAELGEVAASVSGGSANIATVPGFYYSILYKASLDASWTERLPRVLGTGDAVPITVPKAGTAGFYQLKVSPVGKAE